MPADDRHPGSAGAAPGAMLYHQVHPLKLATDFGTAGVSLALLWQHRLGAALVVMWIPSIIASALLVRFGDFSRTAGSSVGAYLRRYMTRLMQAVRFAGMGLAAVGAWLHVSGLVIAGAAVVLWGWTGPWLVQRLRSGAMRAPRTPS